MKISSIKGIKRVVMSLIIAGLVMSLAVNVAIAHGAVDQSNPGPFDDPRSFWEPATYFYTQTFIPQEDNIVSVDLYLTYVSGHSDSADVTVSILESIGGANLGYVTMTVTGLPVWPDWETTHFDFPSAITLVPGNTYVLEVRSTEDIGLATTGDFLGDGTAYPDGELTLSGVIPLGGMDLGFTTYFEEGTRNKGDILKDSGVPGKGLDDAPGLQKEFNEKGKGADNAGKK